MRSCRHRTNSLLIHHVNPRHQQPHSTSPPPPGAHWDQQALYLCCFLLHHTMTNCVLCNVSENTLIANAKRKDKTRGTKRKRSIRLWDILDSMFHVNSPTAHEEYKLCHRCCNKLRRCGQKCGNQYHKECRKGNLKAQCEENLRTVLTKLPRGSYAIVPHFFKVNDSIPACRAARRAAHRDGAPAGVPASKRTDTTRRLPRSRGSRTRRSTRTRARSKLSPCSPCSSTNGGKAASGGEQSWRLKREGEPRRRSRRRRVSHRRSVSVDNVGVETPGEPSSSPFVWSETDGAVKTCTSDVFLPTELLPNTGCASPMSMTIASPLDLLHEKLMLTPSASSSEVVSSDSMIVVAADATSRGTETLGEHTQQPLGLQPPGDQPNDYAPMFVGPKAFGTATDSPQLYQQEEFVFVFDDFSCTPAAPDMCKLERSHFQQCWDAVC